MSSFNNSHLIKSSAKTEVQNKQKIDPKIKNFVDMSGSIFDFSPFLEKQEAIQKHKKTKKEKKMIDADIQKKALQSINRKRHTL